MPDIQWREPESFAAGDTLKFQRSLPGFMPADGWSLLYTLTNSAGVQKDTFVSTTSGDFHAIEEKGWVADLTAGVYVLAGFAVKGTGQTQERHQIYYAELTLLPDLGDATADGSQETEAQTNIRLLTASYRELAQKLLKETDVQRSRFVLQDQTQVLEDLKYWKAVRLNEIQLERARNGQNPGNVQDAVFRIG